ncbi:MAG: hypothetical protein FIA89_10600 [Geobacter sp.]|nr:hypothetical protein [Geobacter sp.]
MTKQDWTYTEERLKQQYAIVVLLCDGYRLSLTLNRIGNMELAICTYINGEMKGSWFLDDCEERRRFMRPIVKYVMSAKDRKSWVKDFGKRYLKAKGIDVDKTYTTYLPWWKSFRSLKAHLIANNTSIELVDTP